MRTAIVLVAAFCLAAPLVPLVSSAGSPPTFKLVDSGATGSELNLGVTPSGAIFVGGWNSVRRSLDDGATWSSVNGEHFVVLGLAADRVLITDHATGRVILEDTDLACTLVSWSDDLGASWLHNPAVCGSSATDHAKVAVGPRVTPFPDPTGLLYANLMYMCANGLADTGCSVSADGGLTFTPTAPHGVGCAFQGTPVADVHGNLFEPTSACGGQVRRTTNAGLTWSTFNLPGAQFPISADTPDVAVTPDGTMYFFYTTSSWQPAVARSTDGGFHWQGPFVAPVAGLTSSAFPVIVSGDDGRFALAWYGTTDDAAGWDHNPGSAPATIRWNAYMAVVTDGEAATPTISPVALTTNADPLQYGCISKMGGCLDNIADYMDVDVGPDGRAYAIFVDGCLPGCTSRAGSTSSEGIVAVQTSGDDLKA